MAFPVLTSVTDTDFDTSVTSMPVNFPATVNSGDRLVAVAEVRNAGTWSTVPTGFTELAAQAGGGAVGKLTVFEKIADGTEDGGLGTWVHSASTSAAWQLIRVTGAHASTASEVATTSGDASAADPPSKTTSWGGSEDNLWLAIAGHAAISTTPWSAAPSGYSGFAQNGASSGGAAVAVAHGYKEAAADTENPGTFTVSGSNRFWAAATLAIRPAAGGGGVTITSFKTLLGVGQN